MTISFRRKLIFFVLVILTIITVVVLLNIFISNKSPKISLQTKNKKLRAAHMTGNWSGNVSGVKTLDRKYFDYLHGLNVNWVGISVALHIKDSTDSTVVRRYFGVDIPTFKDEDLKRIIRNFHKEGFSVYLSLAFEDQESRQAQNHIHRWQLGYPTSFIDEEEINPKAWPWNPNHPNHKEFTEEFWKTYTDQAVHFAKLAQDEGVEMYSLGTETEGLFRTRKGDGLSNEFADELKQMVYAVRKVYKEKVTYDMHYSALTNSNQSTEHLWDDLELDVVGISAYFELTDTLPTSVLSVSTLEKSWEKILKKYLIPLKKRNSDKQIIFLEFGYVNAVDAPYKPDSEAMRDLFIAIDSDGNGLDDAQEQQANIYQAFFNTVDKYPAIVEGAFLWGESFPEKNYIDIWGVRTKLAEKIVRQTYAKWRNE